MSDLINWQSLLPTKPPLQRGVYLGYPSSDTHVLFMIQLYDALRHDGFSVRLAQYVRRKGQQRPPKHQADLAECEAGILIWPKDPNLVPWFEQEYGALRERRADDPNFPIVVLHIDNPGPNRADLPFQIDCSAQSEGPYGSSLLNIYHLVMRKPPQSSPIALKLDKEIERGLQSIAQIQSKADQQLLVSQATSKSFAWSASPLLGTVAANKLIKMQANDEALAILKSVRERFPTTIRYRQLQGLAYRRLGDLDESLCILEGLYSQREFDPETLGISAAGWMEAYVLTGDKRYLLKSRNRYVQAFKRQPANYYVGINAATKSMLYRDEDKAQEYAREVGQVIGGDKDYWAIATRAEIQLLLRDFDAAERLYKEAVAVDRNAFGSHSSTWLQAKRLLDYFERESRQPLSANEAAQAYAKISSAFPGVGPALDFNQEVRLAVVMYGGVSLAIYINGVAQELLNLVRATAPIEKGEQRNALAEHDLTSTEKVYRKLAQLFGRPSANGTASASADPKPADPIRTRFLVDIISGTSAGGINGMFLAKAIAQNMNMNGLKQMWIDDADISKLLNDQNSSTAPKSLLDGKYMYRKLLEALRVMEDPKSRPPAVSAVEELDLFITTTDIHGLPLPITLADQKIYEKRHKNVFRFRHMRNDKGQQDFKPDNNPFMAFAARCTSAFPFAFEPMKLSDIEGKQGEEWNRFYAEYEAVPDPQPFTKRCFGDGGYLDNKPFSHAVGEMLRRRAEDKPVQRKLIYIEPAPETLSAESAELTEVNALQNVIAAAFTLPTYETIREDLQVVQKHNRLVDQVEKLTKQIESDLARYELILNDEQRSLATDVNMRVDGKWGDHDLEDMIKSKGMTYGSYHRLKVEHLVQQVSQYIAAVSGIGDNSDLYLAIPYLVRAWIDHKYDEFDNPDPTRRKPTQNCLLVDFDLGYRLRRINFIRAKIDRLAQGDKDAQKLLQDAGGIWPQDIPTLELALVEIKRKLNHVHRKLRGISALLRQIPKELGDVDNPLHEAIKDAPKLKEILTNVAKQPTEEKRRQAAMNTLDEWEAQFDQVATALSESLKPIFVDAANASHKALDPQSPSRFRPRFTTQLQAYLWRYYQRYEDYDHVAFPILYQTATSEAARVDVLRISPEPGKKQRLAGTALANFGGFLDRGWRENDMMWGRLDASRRILEAFLPEGSQRTKLINEAEEIIIEEQFMGPLNKGVRSVLFDPANVDKKAAAEWKKSIDELKVTAGDARKYVIEERERPEALDPQMIVNVMSRSTQVMGKILEGLADDYQQNKQYVAWITRLGIWFWGLVQVAVPGSIASKFFQNWLALLYTFEIVVIVGGSFLVSAPLLNVGFLAFVITVVVNVAVVILRDYLANWTGRNALIKLFKLTCVLAICLVSILAVLSVFPKWTNKLQDAVRTVVIQGPALVTTVVTTNALELIWRGLLACVIVLTCVYIAGVPAVRDWKTLTWRQKLQGVFSIIKAAVLGVIISILIIALLCVAFTFGTTFTSASK